MYENPMYNPALMPYLGMPQPAPRKQEVIKVNGENGANAINLAPNSSLIALDMSGTMIWLITTDGAGYKTVSSYDIIPHEEPPAPNYADLESRIANLERMMNNAEHSGNAEQKQSDYTAFTADKANDRRDQRRDKSAGNA